MRDIIFDVFWFVEGVKHSYTFFDESDAEQFAKELEEKGYEPKVIGWDPT